MAGTRDNFQGFRSGQAREGLLVEFDDNIVNAANDQKRRRAYLIEDIPGKVRAPAARDNRPDSITEPRRRDEGCRRSRARAEETEAKGLDEWLSAGPVNGIDDLFGRSRISKTLALSASSSNVRRSNKSVAKPCSFSASATAMLRDWHG